MGKKNNIIAIIGRENVGKSTLFNRLVKRHAAITDLTPGVTRDYIVDELKVGKRSLLIADSGGYADVAPGVKDSSLEGVVSQNLKNLAKNAAAVLLMVDGQHGLHPLDEKLSAWLRRTGTPVMLLINKVDGPSMNSAGQEFHLLGWQETLMISARGGRGLGELRTRLIAKHGNPISAERSAEISVAIVGRPNVGKSSIFNALVGFKRSIVYEMPGTTRDAVDSLFYRDEHLYRFIDTAGLYRRRNKQDRLTKFSMDRAKDAIRRADNLLLVLDVTAPYHNSEGQIARIAAAANKNIIILLNKWDLAEEKEERYQEYLKHYRRHFRFLSHAHLLTASALEGQRVNKVLSLLQEIKTQQEHRVATGPLGRLLSEKAPKLRERVKYISQVGVRPPTFLVKAKGGQLHFSFERALINFIRKEAGFKSCAIKLEVK